MRVPGTDLAYGAADANVVGQHYGQSGMSYAICPQTPSTDSPVCPTPCACRTPVLKSLVCPTPCAYRSAALTFQVVSERENRPGSWPRAGLALPVDPRPGARSPVARAGTWHSECELHPGTA
eukprot:2058342-Rhodomonas_salina.1